MASLGRPRSDLIFNMPSQGHWNGFLATQGSEKFGLIWRRPLCHLGALQLLHISVIKVKEKFLLIDGAFFAWCTSSSH